MGFIANQIKAKFDKSKNVTLQFYQYALCCTLTAVILQAIGGAG